MSRAIKIIVEHHPDGYIAYPLGLKGIVVAQGDSSEEALREAISVVEFHIETFGEEVLGAEAPILEAFIADVEINVA